MKVLLVSPNVESLPDPVFPIGLAYIAAGLKKTESVIRSWIYVLFMTMKPLLSLRFVLLRRTSSGCLSETSIMSVIQNMSPIWIFIARWFKPLRNTARDSLLSEAAVSR